MTDKPPKVDNAPGLSWRLFPTKGWEARWRPRRDIVKRGLPMKTATLWCGWDPDETTINFIRNRCQALQGEMHLWSGGGVPVIVEFDGTLGGLIRAYQSDPDSSYRKLQYQTRAVYTNLLKRIDKDHGHEVIRDLRARALLRWHEDWMKSGVSMAHSLVGLLRTISTFGATMLESADCRALKLTLHDMRFKSTKPRTVHLTADHAIAVRKAAHDKGLHSIALAQAFQFECTLRQKDVIGEWLPISEDGISDIHRGKYKWVKGIRWEEIDDELVLRHTTSKRQKEIEIDLKNAPMVMEELRRFEKLPTKGPVIVSDLNGQPWKAYEFRRQWRKLAASAGVPKHVYNMDTRAGAITEAFQAGARIQSVRKAATHSTESMTQRYSRDDANEIAEVMQLRAKNRNKTGT